MSNILLLIILIIISLISYLLYKYQYTIIDKQIKSIYTGDASSMKLCPKGCIRGVCNKNNKNNNNHCKYDYQCNYCKDPITGKYYLNSNVNPKLEILYNSNNIQETNNLIKKQNDYIHQLNKEIQKINEEKLTS